MPGKGGHSGLLPWKTMCPQISLKVFSSIAHTPQHGLAFSHTWDCTLCVIIIFDRAFNIHLLSTYSPNFLAVRQSMWPAANGRYVLQGVWALYAHYCCSDHGANIERVEPHGGLSLDPWVTAWRVATLEKDWTYIRLCMSKKWTFFVLSSWSSGAYLLLQHSLTYAN